MALMNEAADILVENLDRDGNVVTVPDFGFPSAELFRTDEARYFAEQDAAEAREVAWSEAHRARFRCSADGSIVTTQVIGTSWYRSCSTGRHRWQRTFGPNDQWRQIR